MQKWLPDQVLVDEEAVNIEVPGKYRKSRFKFESTKLRLG